MGGTDNIAKSGKYKSEIRWREVKTFLPNFIFCCQFLRETNGWGLGDTAGDMPPNSTGASGKHPNVDEENASREINKHFTLLKREASAACSHTYTQQHLKTEE